MKRLLATLLLALAACRSHVPYRVTDLESGALDWMDSCAVPDHFMINRLWTERCRIGEMIVSLEPMSSRLVTATIAGLRRMRRTFKGSTPVERPDLHD